MYKKIASTLIAGILLGIMPISIYANPKLSDINGHWAKNTIQDFVNKGYISGYEDNTFRPENHITRAEFVKIANNYFGYKSNYNNKFSDIKPSDWFYEDVVTGNGMGYIDGYNDGTFRPNNNLTREEAAKIIASIKHKQDSNFDKISKFPDGNNISNWAKPYVEICVEEGYLKGNEKGYLNPKKNITRAEAVSMLSRVNNTSETEFTKFIPEFKQYLLNNGYYESKNSPIGSTYTWKENNGDINIYNNLSIVFNLNEKTPEFDNSIKGALNKVLPTGGNTVYNIIQKPFKKQTLRLDSKTVSIDKFNDSIIIGIDF